MWDHPRLCGEKRNSIVAFRLVLGSPPPMRGKDFTKKGYSQLVRITPVYAGKSLTVLAWCCHNWDHPRLCGEKFNFFSVIIAGKGSPPPMRGKVPAVCRSVRQSGITPAYAGKSIVIQVQIQCFEDHPRLCGEKGNTEVCGWVTGGSPPPMRGKAVTGIWLQLIPGITPAYAGKSALNSAGWRECYGSPPPMRGKATPRNQHSHQSRITPAYAGKRK